MSIVPVNEVFSYVDSKGARLVEIDAQSLKAHRAVLLRNLAPPSTEDFHAFADNFGFPLPYGDSIEKTFASETFAEDDLHYDGISATHPRKIPSYLLFYVEKALEPDIGGEFIIVDCVRAVKKMPRDLVSFLRDHKQQFFGYQMYQQPPIGPKVLSFEIDCITTLRGIDRLRLHLPFNQDSQELNQGDDVVFSKPHNFSLGFSGCSGETTLRVFNEIREVLRTADITWTLSFQDHDLLVVDNDFAFHGRHRLVRPSPRIMRRIQLLASPYRPQIA